MSFHRIISSDVERERFLRTDTQFRSRFQTEHHREDSILENLPIDMIKSFPTTDSLHLLHLGITKR